MRRSIPFAVIAVATPTLVGLVAAAAAVGFHAVAATDADSNWRELLGPLAGLSIGFAFVAAILGIIAIIAVTADDRPSHRRTAVTVVGFALGVITLGHWIWLGQHIG
jgi:biotin transporter BioY